jgi:hypothetical protein
MPRLLNKEEAELLVKNRELIKTNYGYVHMGSNRMLIPEVLGRNMSYYTYGETWMYKHYWKAYLKELKEKEK